MNIKQGNVEKLENLLDRIATSSRYFVLPAMSINEKINKMNYQMDLMFWGFALIVSVAAGYSLYKCLKRGY